MNSAGQYFKLTLFSTLKPIYLFALFAAFVLVGCGSQDETSATPAQESQTLSFKVPDAILASKLDLNAGTLTATISYGTTTAPMTISPDGLTASVTLENVPLGSTDFTILFTYNLAPFGPLDVAQATQNFDIVAGSNALSFTAAYDTAIFDDDGDGVSNIVELDEFSVSSPVVALCELGTAVLGSCELGS